jgi:hypothetical protein
MAARLLAQRGYLGEAVRLIANIPGPVFEIGLGKGRTYSHLRAALPDREIYCFDRELHAPAEETPPVTHLFLGEFHDTVPQAAARLGVPIALAHCDFGTRHRSVDQEVGDFLAGVLPAIMAAGAVVASDRALSARRLEPVGMAGDSAMCGLPAWPYHLYRVSRQP